MTHTDPIEKLFRMSEAYYLPKGYHTPEHRQAVIENARRLGSLAIKSGRQYDPVALDLAAGWHDAGLAFNPGDIFFKATEYSPHADYTPDCAERLSAVLFRQEAGKLGISRGLGHLVFTTILGTNPDMPIKTTEAKLLAAADLVSVGLGNYQEFKDNTVLLWQEAQMKKGDAINWQDFVAGSMNYLGKFTARKIHLTPDYYDEDGNSRWHVGAVNNILSLAQETWPNLIANSVVRPSNGEIPYQYEEITLAAQGYNAYSMVVKVPLENSQLITV